MDLFFQQLLNGLSNGSVYSLVALGLTMVFGILHVPNFAQGAFYMVGAYVTLTVMTIFGIPYWIAMFISMLAIASLAVLSERIIFHPLRKAEALHQMMGAIGILLFLVAFAQVIWGPNYQQMSSPYGNAINLLGITVTQQRLIVIVATVIIMIILHLFLTRTMIGSAIVAMAQNREGAFLVGINANTVAMLTFAISGILAAAAATLASPINLVFPGMGDLVIMKAFVIIIIGGMGSIPGAIIAGYILGIVESFGATYISGDYKDIIAFVLLVIILSVKPTGLFPGRVN
ncbi:branched-chain amino acid ABC transporter permease [Oceanobacillus caeni]|uniref:branched-chain amino acid ABC transporter permease n=1 Tax=Bacillaceae TaxID=186817 RepID=UPI0006226F98|nr:MULTISPECIES: branched-chain amino acid ABC transporter permease [Bacillaceae]KKE79790.1 ABC transporter permease [Bacilli bacterium VT-13-104]PZD89495.1 branched-chain amino acid ABC transporter permease [Bacilli bacterium]MBU8789272.1 branched-chain amino acid ABC transporter permease [Oceanobacillus caeni]MCR1832943.1 branched-chain amino acid ABC transporter permease [Oceanobacillus caeni]PZD91017.1 branched-chain amino acid ABC transporter permease [Bacilli bacterium]